MGLHELKADLWRRHSKAVVEKEVSSPTLPLDILRGPQTTVGRVGLFIRVEAKPGKEEEVSRFLSGAMASAERDAQTAAWFALRFGFSSFGIFDAFEDEAGRQAHLSGEIVEALMKRAPDLLAKPLVIEKVDVLAAKMG